MIWLVILSEIFTHLNYLNSSPFQKSTWEKSLMMALALSEKLKNHLKKSFSVLFSTAVT